MRLVNGPADLHLRETQTIRAHNVDSIAQSQSQSRCMAFTIKPSDYVQNHVDSRQDEVWSDMDFLKGYA